MRLYIKPKSKADLAALEVFRAYGVTPVLGTDKRGSYYSWTPPGYWKQHRRTRFQEAIERLDWL